MGPKVVCWQRPSCAGQVSPVLPVRPPTDGMGHTHISGCSLLLPEPNAKAFFSTTSTLTSQKHPECRVGEQPGTAATRADTDKRPTLCFRTGVSLPSGSRAEPGAAGKQLCICPQGSPNWSDPEGSHTHVCAHAAEWATASFHSACDLCNHPEKLPARKPCSFSRTRGLDARHSRNPSRVLLAGPRISVRTGVFSSSAPAFTCS